MRLKPLPLKVRDYNADGKLDWHDYYDEALSPVQHIAIRCSQILFTATSALVHTIWFTLWLALGLNINLLTLIVSLEAIYITLFIGLGQNLADQRSRIHAAAEKKEADKAARHREQLAEQQAQLLTQNTDITEQIEKLTEEIHRHLGIKA